ncbi:MAG: inorganic diphosphatase, partial [Gorillibacterium sp.]|nr:inorganic diphosphatase [Gorillibacterium sp.]
FIPKTLAGDGDPVDVLVITPHPIVAGSIVKCRAVAVLDTEDEKGTDAKLVAVPVDKVSNGAYPHLNDLSRSTSIRSFYDQPYSLDDHWLLQHIRIGSFPILRHLIQHNPASVSPCFKTIILD